MSSAAPPIIVTGMHRSGTTLCVELLNSVGAFFGSNVDPNAEDFFFLRLDEWVMRRAGGAWDYPLPTLRYLEHRRFFDDTLEFLKGSVASHAAASARRGAWGFKDPRIVFTGPLWARVFPGAPLVYIHRNGVDAANSLFVREHRRWETDDGDRRYLEIRPLVGRVRDAFKSMESFEAYLFSTRCLSLAEAFRLWEEYVEQGERLYDGWNGPKLRVRYESLIANPAPELDRVARFCGLAPTHDALREAVSRIDTTRALAFVKHPDLCAFYETVKATRLMTLLEYDAIKW